MVSTSERRCGPLQVTPLACVAAALLLLPACSELASQSDGPCVWTGKYKNWVYQERQLISTYSRPLNLNEAKRMVPSPFLLEEPARVRISVLDLYEMAEGATYKEGEVSLLARHNGELGWYIVTLPVTDSEACGGGVAHEGFPKMVRRVTLERDGDRYFGVIYQRGGQQPEFTLRLTLNNAALTNEARTTMNQLAQLPSYTRKDGVVFRFPGYPRPLDELTRAMPASFDVKFGYPNLDVPDVPGGVLHRLAVVQPDYGFWMRMRARYSLNPQRR